MDLDNIQRKYGLPAPLPVVQNGKFATRFPLNLEHRGDDVFQFGGKYIGEIENIYDLLYKILTNQEIDASLALPYAIKITEDKLYIRDKTNSEWITIFDITKPNFPKEIELYELIYKAITHQVIGEDTSYPGQFKIEENILYVRDKDNLIWTQIGDVTKEFLGATEATQAILDQVNEILTEVQELKTELNRQIATANETLTTALQAANEAMTSAQSINIRTFNSVKEMKASNTLKAGALAKTLGFYTAGDGGGADYVIVDDISEDEADEASIIALQKGLYAKFSLGSSINVLQFGAKRDGTEDSHNAIQKVISFVEKTRLVPIYFSSGYYNVSNPLIITKQGMHLEGVGNAVSILQYTGDEELNKDLGLITFKVGTPETDSEVWGSWGIVLRHLNLKGNGKKIHALYLRKIGYPLMYDVSTEYFNGSGLLLDKCQDGSFENMNIQLCGRLKEGETDVSDINATEYSAIHLFSTVSGDACNMLRFNKCQIENNNCSPYVYVGNGIGIWFNQTHGEDRNGNGRHTFMVAKEGDIELTDTDLSATLKYGFIRTGYGSLHAKGGRNIGNIAVRASGMYGTNCIITNVGVGNISIEGYRFDGLCSISNCKTGDITMSYVANYINISNVHCKSLTLKNTGEPNGLVKFTNNFVDGNVTKSGENEFHCTNNRIGGDVKISGGNTFYKDNKVIGTETCNNFYDQHTYLPQRKIGISGSIPIYSIWNVGDIVYNSNPTAGSYVGWVCVTAGTPGTWKGFGLIQS